MLGQSQKYSVEINPHNPSECHLSLAYRNLSSIPIFQIKQFLQKESIKVLGDIDKKISQVERKRKMFIQTLFRRGEWEDQDIVAILNKSSYETLKHDGLTITVLDLSNNSFGNDNPLSKQIINLDFMKDTIHTLILDSNDLTHHFLIPECSKLTTLSLNNNNIKHLSYFIEKLRKTCPKITNLSLLKNPCCSNYFTGKQLSDEKRYRSFVIGRLPTLTVLDGSKVSQEEREEGERLYANWEEKIDLGIGSITPESQKTSMGRTISTNSLNTTSGLNTTSNTREIYQEKVNRNAPESEPVQIESSSGSENASLSITSYGNVHSENTVPQNDDSFSGSSYSSNHSHENESEEFESSQRETVQKLHPKPQPQYLQNSFQLPQVPQSIQPLQGFRIPQRLPEISNQTLQKSSGLILPDVPKSLILPEVPNTINEINNDKIDQTVNSPSPSHLIGAHALPRVTQSPKSTLNGKVESQTKQTQKLLSTPSPQPLNLSNKNNIISPKTALPKYESHNEKENNFKSQNQEISVTSNTGIKDAMKQHLKLPVAQSDSSDEDSGSDNSDW